MKLVLLPGLDGTGELFAPLISALPNTITPVVVSYPRDEVANYNDLLEIAKRSFPVNESFAILGESFSGPIATQLAAESDTGICALIYSCSFVRNPSRSLAALKPIVSVVPIHGFLPNTVRNLLVNVKSPEIRAMLDDSLSSVSAHVVRDRLRQILEIDETQSLRDVSVPILYLRASNDRLVKPRSGDHIQTNNAKTKIVQIDGSHLLLQTNPAACAHEISGFLRNLS